MTPSQELAAAAVSAILLAVAGFVLWYHRRNR
jgi:hypothetical protein